MIVVYAYVVADLLHVGHIVALENAKALGDKLIVGVLTEEATMEKKSKPVLSFAERLRLVKALGCVDAAIPQKTYSPTENFKSVGADILIESQSHSIEDLKKTKIFVYLLGKRMVVLPYYSEQSSSKIKEKIKK